MPLVLYEQDGGVVTLTLNLPGKLNAMAIPLQLELRQAVGRIANDTSVRAAILTGSGRAFSVGADLSSLDEASGDRSLGDQMAAWMEEVSIPLIHGLRSMPVPLVCAVNGPAAGAGVGLALCGDVVIAARSAYFYLPFLPKLGIVPDLGCTWALPRLAGHARSMGMALLDERLSAERALQWGLIWECVDDEALMPTASRMAGKLAALPSHAVAEARAAFAGAQGNTLDQQLHFEKDRQRELVGRPEFAEGVAAFLHKRPPVFAPRAVAGRQHGAKP